MLCRALLAAAVFAYVLCVLLLSGVQKEDIDASTLRKLQRHNVNIDDINDRQLRKQCLGKTDVLMNLTTTQMIQTTEKPKITVTDNGPNESQDTKPLQTIFQYLEFMGKKENNITLESKDDTKTSELRLEPLTKFLSGSSFRDRPPIIHFEDPSSETLLHEKAEKNHDKTISTAAMNTELENLINILRTNIRSAPTASNATREENTTARIEKDVPLSKNTSDIEYITKIVKEIISKGQLGQLTTSNGTKPNLYTNKTLQVEKQTSDAHPKNKSTLSAKYYLSNCNVENFYANNVGDKDTLEILDDSKKLTSGVNNPETSASNYDYFMCNRSNTAPNQNENPIINNILNELKKVNQKFNLLYNESVMGTTFQHLTRSKKIFQKNDSVKTSNNQTERPNLTDKENIRALENQSKIIMFNEQRDPTKTNDVYKNMEGVSEEENNKALKIVLQTQSKLFNQIFNQQKNLIKLCNTDKEKNNLRKKESPKHVHSELKNILIGQIIDNQNEPTVNMYTHKKEQGIYPLYINGNTNNVRPKLGDEQTKPPTPNQLPLFHYKPSNSDNGVINEEYKGWRLTALNTLSKEYHATETSTNGGINNRVNDKIKTINTLHSNPNLAKEHKRPWFHAELNNKQYKTKNYGNQQGIFFIPNVHNKVTDEIESRLKKPYEKSWSPYFDDININNTIIKNNEYVNPALFRSDDPHTPRESINNGEHYPKIVRPYQYENESPSVIEGQAHCQITHETRIKCLSAADYKTNWDYYRNQQNKKVKSNEEEHNEDSEFYTKNIRVKNNNYSFPSRPIIDKKHLASDTTLDRFKINEDDLLSKNETKEGIKPPVFPPNVIKDIAMSIKDFVLRDLKNTTAKTLSTMTIIPPTKIIPTTTKTLDPTTTTPTTTMTAKRSTTTATEETLKSSAKLPLKIQDASKTLEKLMEMLEKITLIKDKILKHENPTHTEILKHENLTRKVLYNRKTTVTTQKASTKSKERPVEQKDATPKNQNADNRILPYPLPFQQNFENNEIYVPQIEHMKVENLLSRDSQPIKRNPENHEPYDTQVLQRNPGNQSPIDLQSSKRSPENRMPYDSQTLQQSSVNREPYMPQATQLKEENRLPFYPHPSVRNPDNLVSYDQKALQRNPKNFNPYVPNVSQHKIVNPTPYVPQIKQLEKEGRFLYDPQLIQNNPESRLPHDTQLMQRNEAEVIPNYLQHLQSNQGSRTQYDTQGLQMKAENRYDLQSQQSDPENCIRYDTENRTNVLDIPKLETENQVRYYPLPIQSKTENRSPYDVHRLHGNPENRGPYRQYLPHTENGVSNDPQVVRLKTEKHLPYDPQPLQNDAKNRPFDYSMMDPYQHSKSEYNAYLKEVQAPLTKSKVKPSPRKQVITVQTNSGEISPLKIILQKPFVQNIVLTTQPPVTIYHSDETFNFRKPSNKLNPQEVKVKESEVSNLKEDTDYMNRHTHNDNTHHPIPKFRKTKKERELIQHYMPRNLQEIERFHEKLEKGDFRPRGEEKIAKRVQRPIVKNTNYDDTHFRNFLQTQQKVNDMLEKILASGKTKPMSAEIL